VDREIAFKFVNAEVFKHEKRNLSPLEITIFCGSWSGDTYDRIANSSEYSFNYLMRDAGPKFWRLLTKIFGENVNKNNIPSVIEKLHKISNPNLAENVVKVNSLSSSDRAKNSTGRRDWENAPAKLNPIYGDREELNMLENWIGTSHLINIWGTRGVGKTALMREIASRVDADFDFIIWRSLAGAPTFADLVNSFSQILALEPHSEKTDWGTQLLAKMRSHSCLILLDGVEAILQPGQQAGTYLAGYEDYGEFFQLMGESFHQSCLIATSLESLGGIFQFAGENSPIHSLRLAGLSLPAAQSFLVSKQLKSQPAIEELVNYYQGNPAMLRIAAKIIRELFNHHVGEFLAQKSLIFGDIVSLLEASFIRLSMLEREVLFWLASEEKPVTLSEIQSRIPISIYPVELLETLESLNQRALIQSSESKSGSCFSLSPLIREFTTDRLLDQMEINLSFQERHQIYKGAARRRIKINTASQQQVNLSQWQKGRFEPDWQPLERLFTLSNKAPVRLRSAFHFRDRATIKRFKEIELDTETAKKVLLLVAITEDEAELRICVQAQPEIRQRILPSQLQVCLVDAADNIATEITSGMQDNFIQLPYFYGDPGEKFVIRLNLDAVSHEEEFSL